MRLFCCCLVMLLLAACGHERVRPASGGVDDNIHLPQSRRYAQAQDSGPSVDAAARELVAGLTEPVPKVEPLSRYGNGPTYEVRGRKYHVLPDARGYRARGVASWYGSKFQGHLTSSLERYDMYKFTAAHKTLPLPTYVRVTNLDNGRSVVVRVNDRGPFVDDRLIDLSWAAAVRLGYAANGTARVLVAAIDPRHAKEPSADPVVTPAAGDPGLYLQVGAFADRQRAQEMLLQLQTLGISAGFLQHVETAGRKLTRVRIGPLAGPHKAQAVRATLRRHGIIAMTVNESTKPRN